MTFAIIRRPDGTVEGIASLGGRFAPNDPASDVYNVYFDRRHAAFRMARLRPVRPEDMFASYRRAQEALAKA